MRRAYCLYAVLLYTYFYSLLAKNCNFFIYWLQTIKHIITISDVILDLYLLFYTRVWSKQLKWSRINIVRSSRR